MYTVRISHVCAVQNTFRDVCYYTRWFWTTIRYWFMTTVFLFWTTSYRSRRHISGFRRHKKALTDKYVAENDNIVLFACLDHYYHLSVCEIGIRKTSVVDMCS